MTRAPRRRVAPESRIRNAGRARIAASGGDRENGRRRFLVACPNQTNNKPFMKKLPLLSLAFLLAALPAHAGTETYSKQIHEPASSNLGGPYWAIFGGVNVHQEADLDDTDTAFGSFSNDLDSELGWFGGLKFGYEFENRSWAQFAVELEAFYSHVDADFNADGGAFKIDSSGDIHAAVAMVNAIVKFKPVWQIRPYVGVGAGVAHLWLRDASSDIRLGDAKIGRVAHEDDEDWTFAYQGIAGIDWWVTDRWTLFTENKALVFHDGLGIDDYLNHLVGVGVRMKF